MRKLSNLFLLTTISWGGPGGVPSVPAEEKQRWEAGVGGPAFVLWPGWAMGPVPRPRYGWGWGRSPTTQVGGPRRGPDMGVCVRCVLPPSHLDGLVGSTACADTHGPISS